MLRNSSCKQESSWHGTHLELAALNHVQLRGCKACVTLLDEDFSCIHRPLKHFLHDLALKAGFKPVEQQQLGQGGLQRWSRKLELTSRLPVILAGPAVQALTSRNTWSSGCALTVFGGSLGSVARPFWVPVIPLARPCNSAASPAGFPCVAPILDEKV